MAQADTESDVPSDTDAAQPDVDAPTALFYLRALAKNMVGAAASTLKQKAKRVHALVAAGVAGLGAVLAASAPVITTAVLIGIGLAVLTGAAFALKLKLS